VGSIGKYAGGEILSAEGWCGGVDPSFPWPQFTKIIQGGASRG